MHMLQGQLLRYDPYLQTGENASGIGTSTGGKQAGQFTTLPAIFVTIVLKTA
jgi:hypothetical protein